jgi:hypothetical protein
LKYVSGDLWKAETPRDRHAAGASKSSERAPLAAGGREAQRQQTRKRICASALADFKRLAWPTPT